MNFGLIHGLTSERVLGSQTFAPQYGEEGAIVQFVMAPPGAAFARVTGMSNGGNESYLNRGGNGYVGYPGSGAYCSRVPLPIEPRYKGAAIYPDDVRGLWVALFSSGSIQVGRVYAVGFSGSAYTYAGANVNLLSPDYMLELTPGNDGTQSDASYNSSGGAGGSATIYLGTTIHCQGAGGAGGSSYGTQAKHGTVARFGDGLLVGGTGGSSSGGGGAGNINTTWKGYPTASSQHGADPVGENILVSGWGLRPTTAMAQQNYPSMHVPGFVTLEWIG